MSGSAKQLAGGLLGAFIGSYFGFAGIGFSLGSALFASSPETDLGTDPGDLTFSTAAYGKYKFFGFGPHPITTFPFWTTDYTPHKHKVEQSGGKGGGGTPEQTFYTFTRSSAYYLCDCEEGQPITGIRMIRNKVTGEVYYYSGDDADAATIIQSNKFARSIRIYTGTDAQTPDPLIVSKEGWAPAWKRRAYMVVEDEDFGEQKGNRILEIEVVRGGVEALRGRLSEQFQQNVDYGNMVITNFDNGVYRIWDKVETSLSVPGIVHLIDANGNYLGQEPVPVESLRRFTQDNYPLDLAGYDEIGTLGSGEGTYYIYQGNRGNYPESGGGPLYLSALYAGSTTADFAAKNFSLDLAPDRYVIGLAMSADHKRMLILMGDNLGTPDYQNHTDGLWYMYDDNLDLVDSGTCDYSAVGGASSSDFGFGNTLKHTTLGMCMMESDYTHVWTGKNKVVDVWKLNGNVFEFYARHTDETTLSSNKFPSIYADNGVAFYAGQQGGSAPGAGVDGYTASFSRAKSMSDTSPTLPEVATELFQRAKRAPAQYDVSLLPNTPVRMRINRLRPARDWLLELGRIYGYRMRKRGDVVQLIPKGMAPVATIPQADLGMEVANGDGEPNLNPPINAARIEGVDLPRSVAVLFTDADNGYADGQQIYTLPNYEQGKDITINLKHHVMTAGEAKNLAQIACKEPHLERMGWETTLGIKWMGLEAADVVDLPTGRAWIKSVIERGDNILRCTLQAEASSAYTGNGLPGAAPAYTSPTIPLAGPTKLEVFDAPALTDSMATPGYLLAATGYLSGWKGANVYVSSNGGETFSLLTAFDTPCVMGYAVDVLADGVVGRWDRVNTVTIQLYNGASMSSSTITDVLNGDNSFILGDEVCKAVDVVALGNDQFRLSILQRGRKGTEWATASHAEGDRFLLLNSAVQRIPVSVDAIGTERTLKAVSLGNELADTTTTVSITPATAGMKPWPPADAEAYQSGADWVINCLERTRVGGDWRNNVGIIRDPDFDGWDLEILSSDGLTVMHTETELASPTYTYLEADQIAEFGAAQTDLRFRWYQRSLTVGRGYPAEEIAA